MIAPVAITTGDPGGIGPDVCLLGALAGQLTGVVLCDPAILSARVKQLGIPVSISDADAYDPSRTTGVVYCEPVAAADPDNPAGVSSAVNAGYCLSMLDHALDGIKSGRFSALVTGPLQKSTIREGGFPAFTGHTEYLRDHFGLDQVVMMLASNTLRVALATTHVPLKEVSAALSMDELVNTGRLILDGLTDMFGLDNPKLGVLGLNPHAGESGHLGTEEITTIGPAIDALRLARPSATILGPLPADTAFTPTQRAAVDAYLAMYHDQGLPVVKYSGFGETVNITLGLPIIRTSVDHGTALSLAGRGTASPDGLIAAIHLATTLALGRASKYRAQV